MVIADINHHNIIVVKQRWLSSFKLRITIQWQYMHDDNIKILS